MDKIKIYLAGPVGNEEDGGRQWREKAVQIFKHASEDSDIKYDPFDPTNFFSYDEVKHQSDT